MLDVLEVHNVIFNAFAESIILVLFDPKSMLYHMLLSCATDSFRFGHNWGKNHMVFPTGPDITWFYMRSTPRVNHQPPSQPCGFQSHLDPVI